MHRMLARPVAEDRFLKSKDSAFFPSFSEYQFVLLHETDMAALEAAHRRLLISLGLTAGGWIHLFSLQSSCGMNLENGHCEASCS